jgi:hypothetical protein
VGLAPARRDPTQTSELLKISWRTSASRVEKNATIFMYVVYIVAIMLAIGPGQVRVAVAGELLDVLKRHTLNEQITGHHHYQAERLRVFRVEMCERGYLEAQDPDIRSNSPSK